MSTIRVDNFGPSAGGTTYSARGIAKAWVNFNGTGTIAARDSLNLSSLTDNGTGDFTTNYTNAFSAADYTFGGVTAPNSLSNGFVRIIYPRENADVLTSSTRLFCTYVGASSSGLFDYEGNVHTCHGDLA